MRSAIQKRFRDHLVSKGKLPKMEEETPMMSSGGVVDDMDDKHMYDDEEWNEHDDDTSGEPRGFDTANGFADGGEVQEPSMWDNIKSNLVSGKSKENKSYGSYAFGGEIHAPKHGDEGGPEMSEHEVHRALAMSLMRRKQLRPGA